MRRRPNPIGDIDRKDLHSETGIVGVTKSCMGCTFTETAQGARETINASPLRILAGKRREN